MPAAPYAGGGLMPGLVVSSTSVPRPDACLSIPVDPVMSRCRRLRRSVKWAAALHDQVPRGQRKARAAMVTLTYAAVDGWEPKHVSEFIRRVRKWALRRGFPLRYVWVAELQQRGAVHYHMIVWLPRGLTMPKPDKQGWWPHGCTQVKWAERPVGYMVKYASKFDGACVFPAGLRTHGAGGFDAAQRDARHWLGLPGWLRGQVGVGERCPPVVGGGRVHRPSGELIVSPWRVSLAQGTVHVRQLWGYSDHVLATGPYSRLEPSNFERVSLCS